MIALGRLLCAFHVGLPAVQLGLLASISWLPKVESNTVASACPEGMGTFTDVSLQTQSLSCSRAAQLLKNPWRRMT